MLREGAVLIVVRFHKRPASCALSLSFRDCSIRKASSFPPILVCRRELEAC
jgi:hypothetical protein